MHDQRAATRAASAGDPDEPYRLPQDRERLLEDLFHERLRRACPVSPDEVFAGVALSGNERASLERLSAHGATVRLATVGHGRVTFVLCVGRRRQAVSNSAGIIAACGRLGIDVYRGAKRPERLVHQGRRRHAQVRPIGRAPRRSTNARPRGSRRSGSSSSTASADPGEPDEADPRRGRFCGGCGRDISDRRADARTCGATCRQRVKRGDGVEQLLAEREATWRDAARLAGQPGLTRALDVEIRDAYATPRPEAERAAIARRTDVDMFDELRWLMETNGVIARKRSHPVVFA